MAPFVGEVEVPDGLESVPLRLHLIEVLRSSVPFDFSAWLVTDPVSWVGSAPLADIPPPLLPQLPRLIRLRYSTAINRWTALPPAGVGLLHQATAGDLAASQLWREVLRPTGVSDVASLVFADRFGCWGFLELWRVGGTFTDAEGALLEGAVSAITPLLRSAQAKTFDVAPPPAPPAGPVVLLLSDGLDVRAQTPQTADHLRLLVPPTGGAPPVPAGAYNVAAQLHAVESGVDGHVPEARVHLIEGRWVTLRAARAGADIAVSIEATPPLARADVYARAHGLSTRERQVLDLLVTGADTRLAARALDLSEHTLQDHVKSIFTKTGVQARSQLVSRAVGV